MPDAQLVEHVGVVQGYVRHHDVGHYELAEHVLVDAAGLHDDLGGVAAIDSRLRQGGRDQLLMHALEVDALLVIKSADHKCSHCPTPTVYLP